MKNILLLVLFSARQRGRKFKWFKGHAASTVEPAAFTTGFAVSATLIVAIGAQNAFVLGKESAVSMSRQRFCSAFWPIWC